MLTQADLSAVLEDISYPPTKAAAEHLVAALTTQGLRASTIANKIRAVRFHDIDGRYLFAFIANRTSLLFYIRKPALAAKPAMGMDAKATFGDVTVNTAGEYKVRIHTVADAMGLANWLASGACQLR